MPFPLARVYPTGVREDATQLLFDLLNQRAEISCPLGRCFDDNVAVRVLYLRPPCEPLDLLRIGERVCLDDAAVFFQYGNARRDTRVEGEDQMAPLGVKTRTKVNTSSQCIVFRIKRRMQTESTQFARSLFCWVRLLLTLRGGACASRLSTKWRQ